jgi:hypothetical protein
MVKNLVATVVGARQFDQGTRPYLQNLFAKKCPEQAPGTI